MKIYLVDWDNGFEYEDNENYVKAVFDSYEKAEEYCLNQGYSKTSTKGYFIGKEALFGNKERSLTILESNINSEIDWWGDNEYSK